MDREECRAADERDVLAPLSDRFRIPEGVIYLDGNSLGALQPAVEERVAQVVRNEWGDGLIRSWNDAGWVRLPERIAAQLAPLIGAAPDEVAVTDSTSANLFKALVAARRLRPDRRVIVTDDANSRLTSTSRTVWPRPSATPRCGWRRRARSPTTSMPRWRC